MIYYYIDGVDRGGDISEGSLGLNLGLNRRSNTATFEMFQGTKPVSGSDVKIIRGAEVLAFNVTLKQITISPHYESDFNPFRVGQKLYTLDSAKNYKPPVTVANFDPETNIITIEEASGLITVGETIGELLFGGVISNITDSNLDILQNIVWDIDVVGYEKVFDKKIISDSWSSVDSRYIINDILNTTVNYNVTLDNLSYADNTALQANWTEAGASDPPTVDTVNFIEGNSSMNINVPTPDTILVTGSFPSKDVSQIVKAKVDPQKGFLTFWVKSNDWTNFDALLFMLGDGTGWETNISIISRNQWANVIDYTSNDWQFIKVPIKGFIPYLLGQIDWSNITNVYFFLQTAGGAFNFNLNGIRVTDETSIFPDNLKETTIFPQYNAPSIRPSNLVDNLSKSFEYTWYVDFRRGIQFKDKDVQPCFYQIDNLSNNFDDLQTEIDETQLANRIVIEGGDRELTAIYSQVVRGTGFTREWLTKNKFKNLEIYEDDGTVTDTMEAGTNTTTVNATAHGLTTGDWIVNRTRDEARKVAVVNANQFTVLEVVGQTSGDSFSLFSIAKTVGVENLAPDETMFDFMSNYQEKSIRNSSDKDTIPDTSYLLFKYNEIIPLFLRYKDGGSISALKALGKGDGIFDADKIVNKDITDIETAVNLARATLADYSNPVITGSFKTNYNGFNIGDLLTVSETLRAINGEYVINKISVRQRGGKYKDHMDFSISFGTTLFGAVEFFQRLLAQTTPTEVNVTETVETFVDETETIEAGDVNVVTISSGGWRFEPSIGQPLPSRYNLASYS